MLLLVWVLVLVLGCALVALTKPVLGLGALLVGGILAAVEAFRRRPTGTSAAAASTAAAVDPGRSGLYAAGGIAWSLVGLTFILIIVELVSLIGSSALHALMSSSSISGAGLLQIADQAPLLRVTFGTGVVSDVFLVVAAPAL